MEGESNFQNTVLLLYDLDGGQSPRKQFCRLYLEVLIQWAMGWINVVLISVIGIWNFFSSPHREWLRSPTSLPSAVCRGFIYSLYPRGGLRQK
jgi:hypothetical protein